VLNRMLVPLVAAIAILAFTPSLASATTAVPPLVLPDTQAFLVDSGGSPITADETITMGGSLTFRSTYDVTCNVYLTLVVHPDGTTTVTAPSSFSGCTVSISGCAVSAYPNLDWGGRFVFDFGGDFYDRINASVTFAFSGVPACATTGTITPAGLLSPLLEVDPAAGGLSLTFNTTTGTVAGGGGPTYAVLGKLVDQGVPVVYGLGI